MLLPAAVFAADPKPSIPNPAIDMEGYLKVAAEAAKHRQTRRLSEEDFLKMSMEPGTIVLDARSKEMFDQLHVKGAVNLSFPSIDVASLKKTLSDKEARILIYCNNNFSAAERFFPTKSARRVAEPLDLHRPLQLRLPQRLRTRPAGRSERFQAPLGAAPQTGVKIG